MKKPVRAECATGTTWDGAKCAPLVDKSCPDAMHFTAERGCVADVAPSLAAAPAPAVTAVPKTDLPAAPVAPVVSHSFDGTWMQSGITETYVVVRWSRSCGPQPGTSTLAPEGTVQVAADGEELVFTGPGERVFRTNGCMDPSVTGRDVHAKDPSGRQWRTRCFSPEGDALHATLNTLVAATTDARIDVGETGRYSGRAPDSPCVAEVTRSATLKLIARAPPATDADAIRAAMAAPPASPAPAGAAPDGPSATNPPAPNLRVGGCGCAGDDVSCQVQCTMTRMIQPSVKNCYTRALMTNPNVEGKVTVAVAISPTGAVTSATIVDGSTLPAGVTSCITARIERTQFPAPGGEGLTFEAPYTFHKQ